MTTPHTPAPPPDADYQHYPADQQLHRIFEHLDRLSGDLARINEQIAALKEQPSNVRELTYANALELAVRAQAAGEMASRMISMQVIKGEDRMSLRRIAEIRKISVNTLRKELPGRSSVAASTATEDAPY